MKKALFLLAIVLCIFVSCSSMKNSDYIILSLEENPTTGYRWEFLTDESVLELVKDDFEANSTKGLVGAGGIRTFTFKALKKVDTEVSLYYRRSWEAFPEKPDVVYLYNSKTNSLEKLI